MKIELTETQLQLKEQFHAFVNDEVIPYASENDRLERVNPTIIERLKAMGYLGCMLPRDHGGTGYDQITIGVLNEELGRGCSSVRALLTVHGMTALAIWRWGTDEQRKELLPQLAAGERIGAFGLTEPEVGSDAKNVQSTATLKGDYFVLNGHKKWITMGQIADVFIIIAQCEGKPTAFLVDKNTPGFTVKPMSGLLGVRASMIAELYMDNCQIPQYNLIGNIGGGLSHIALNSLDYGRYTVASGCVGLGQACLEDSIRYARKRKQFGSAIKDNQLIKKMITEMYVDVMASRLLCYKAGYLKEVQDSDSIMETWTAKYHASIMVNRVSTHAVQILGANGCSSAYPVERYYRDARVNEIIEGTTQMHELLIATNALRHV
jgi:alkylation response protein AidB-like acyl-CoA dehydrogenase